MVLCVDITLVEKDGLYSLIDIWQQSELKEEKRPAQWLKIDETKEFIRYISQSKNLHSTQILKIVQEGPNPDIFVYWQIALAYAKYLGPELYTRVDQIFKEKLFKQKEEIMTIAELAVALNVTPETIINYVREFIPEKTSPGIKTLLNEIQVTAIKIAFDKKKQLAKSDKSSKAELKRPDLIRINRHDINGNSIETVNARDLWEFLESKQQFGDWIKNRIEKSRFLEDTDFTKFHNFMKSDSKARIEYYLTLDTVKMISMLENNSKGDAVRKYFIERDNTLRTLEQSFQIPKTLSGALQLAADKTRELEEAQPKIDFYDQVGNAKGTYSIGITAKSFGLGRNTFFEILRKDNLFFDCEPYQRYIDAGYFVVKIVVINGCTHQQTFVTGKGLIWLQKKYATLINSNKGAQ